MHATSPADGSPGLGCINLQQTVWSLYCVLMLSISYLQVNDQILHSLCIDGKDLDLTDG
jgi:hypothetical protein